jgi:hypothetical protein
VTNRSKFSATGYLLVVFLSGLLVGGFAYRLYSVRSVSSSTARPRLTPEEYRARAVKEMTTRLKLSSDQVQQLGQIMDRTQERYREAHERFWNEARTFETAQHEKIRTMLSDTQRAEYQKMLEERERRRHAAGGPRQK